MSQTLSKIPKETLDKARALAALVMLKGFQVPIFWTDAKTVVLHWSRQIGKSYVLAAWAVFRVLSKLLGDEAAGVPGKDWLVCVLSNSKDNGREFMAKVAQICALVGIAAEQEDLSTDDLFDNMQFEARITLLGHVGRIKVLAANPRTARGFSGDLILDEFAFHQDSYAIWDGAEPILSANAEFQGRIASTGNGTSNMFYRMVAGAKADATVENPAGFSTSDEGMLVSRVSRSAAYKLGQQIYSLKTGRPITPEEARAAALDKASYDQNYELAFSDEGSQLLSDDIISAAEYKGERAEKECVLCEQTWSVEALEYLATLPGPLCFGMDVGRTRNLSSIGVGEKIGGIILVRAILRMRDTRLPKQKEELMRLFTLPNIGSGEVDMTGIGLGLVEFAQEELGTYRVRGVNFSTTEKRDERQAIVAGQCGLPVENAKVTELMGLDVLSAFEGHAIRIPRVSWLRESLKKPHKVVRDNKVYLSAADDAEGHADEFWSIALLIRALWCGKGGIKETGGIRTGANASTGARTGDEGFRPRQLGGGMRSLVRRITTAIGGKGGAN